MKHTVYQSTLMMYIAILFFINIVPVTMQTITIEIDGLQDLATSSLDRILGEIDPTIGKFENTTIEILSVLENRIKVNISEALYWLETNLFVLLFGLLLFFIFVLILLNLLDALLTKYDFSTGGRRYAGLAVSTFIFIWLFVAIILSAWPPTKNFDLQIFLYVLVALLSLVALYLIFVWIRCLIVHRYCIHRYFTNTLFNFKEHDNVLVGGSCRRVHPETRELEVIRNNNSADIL
jgi:hypothetical protein